MFDEEEMKNFNQLELKIYEYIVNHELQLPYMSIRDLANEIPTSTTSILRFCKKLGYDGFKEFKYAYKRVMRENKNYKDYDFSEVVDCLRKFDSQYYQQLFNEAVIMLANAESILFLGIGDSGIAGQYGARRFSSYGKYASAINDPYYKINISGKKTVAIVLSVSGETPEVIRELQDCKRLGCQIIAITTTATSTIAKLSDITIPYYINRRNISQIEMTSQIPALSIVENLAKMCLTQM